MVYKKIFILPILFLLIPLISAACQTLNVSNYTYDLLANETASGLTCFNVTVANVTIDCHGYSIIGNDTIDTYGVYTNQFNTTVKNCVIKNFSRAIMYSGATDGLIYNNIINTTFNGGYGIQITLNAHRNNITQNTINNRNATGIYINGGQNNTIDCSGLKIIGENYTSVYGIFNDQANTTIKNCNISNFSTGIYFANSMNSSIENITVSVARPYVSPNGIGIFIDAGGFNRITNSNVNASLGGMGIYTISNNNTIISNTTGFSDSFYGIRLYTSYNNTISNSTGISISSIAILLTTSSNNTIINTTGTSTSGAGIYLFIDSHNNTLTNCTATSGLTNGFRITTSSNNTITNCQISGKDNNYGALYFNSDSKNNILTNCTTNGNGGGYTVVIINGSNNNTFINTTISNATTLLYVAENASSNLFYLNNFTNVSGYYVQDFNGTNYYNTTLDEQPTGNIWYNIINNTVNISGNVSSPFSGFFYGSAGSGYPYNNVTSLGKFSCNFVNCADNAPITNLNSSDVFSPTIILPFYTNGTQYLTTQSLIFNISVTDTSPSHCFINVGGNANQTVVVSSGWCNGTYALTGLSDGNNTINAYSNDTLGNIGLNNSYVVTIDGTAPVITLPSYENGTLKRNIDTLTLNISVTDATTDESACKVDINGTNQTYAVSSGWCNITDGFLTDLSDGNATIKVYANDSLNNWGLNNSYVVKIDTTAPNFTAIENQTIMVNISFIYDINATDAGVGLGNFSVNNTGNFTINYTTGLVTNATALLEGYYFLNVTVNDTLGNMDWRLWSVNLTPDGASPNITIDAPSGTLTSSNVTVNISVVDNAILDTCLYNITNSVGGTVVSNNLITCGLASVEYQTISDGSNYVLTAFANDTTGNSNVTNKTFSVSTAITPSSGGGSSTDVTKYKVNSISADGSHTINVLNNDVTVEKITIEVVNNVKGITVTVKDIDNIQTVVSESVTGLVYDYFNISTANLSNSDIKIVTIEFTVPKSWLAQYGKDADSIVLKRYNNIWQNEITTITDESDAKYTFESNIFGFSAFAIVSEETEQPAAEPVENETEQPVEEPEQEEPKQPNYYYFKYNLKGILPVVIGIAIILLIIAGYIFFRIEKRRQMY